MCKFCFIRAKLVHSWQVQTSAGLFYYSFILEGSKCVHHHHAQEKFSTIHSVQWSYSLCEFLYCTGNSFSVSDTNTVGFINCSLMTRVIGRSKEHQPELQCRHTCCSCASTLTGYCHGAFIGTNKKGKHVIPYEWLMCPQLASIVHYNLKYFYCYP